MTRVLRKIIVAFLIVGTIGLAGYFISTYIFLSQVRYFDADEFAYLSWAHQMLFKRPYIDYYQITPPGFLLFLLPFVKSASASGVSTFLSARLASTILTALTAGVVTLLFYSIKRSWVAFLSGLLFLFLPMPSGKYIEIRPDMLSLLFLLLGMMMQVCIMKKMSTLGAFLSGLFYGLSVLVLQKALPQIVLSTGILFFFLTTQVKNQKYSVQKGFVSMLWYIFGGLVPVILLFLWAIFQGGVGEMWYSLVRLPMEVSKLGALFPVGKSQLFYPNDVYYGTYGWHSGVVVNLLLWVIGIGGAAILVFRKEWGTFLVASAAILSYLFYFYITPLRFAQYLIGSAPFVAIISALGIDAIYERVRRSSIGLIFFFLGSLALGYILFSSFQAVNEPKKNFINSDSVAMREWFEKNVSKNTPVLDMVGLLFYFPQPYYACCVPFGQYAPYLSQPFPSILESLQKDNIQVIYQGGLGRADSLSPNARTYIKEHFTPVFQGQVLVRNDYPRPIDQTYSQ